MNAGKPDAPLIGVTGWLEDLRWRDIRAEGAFVDQHTLEGIEFAGGRPVILSPSAIGAERTVQRIDGLVVLGGPDIAASLYGVDAHAAADPPQERRDESEKALITVALAAGLPLLAICRGMQLLNVVLGGTLHQHLPDLPNLVEHAVPRAPGITELSAFPWARHPIRTESGSLAASCAAADARVHSFHHQGVHRLGDGLVATAWAPDGLVEAVEMPGHERFLLGVQWHPEFGADPACFNHLVEAARAMTRRQLTN